MTTMIDDPKNRDNMYKKIFEEALNAIFVIDAQTGIIVDCNPVASKLVGREKNELKGKHQRILHPPEKEEGELSRVFKSNPEENEGEILEAKIITRNGEIKDVEIQAKIFKVDGKNLIQSVFSDITQRKQAEEMLRESEEKFKAFTNQTTEGIALADMEGNYVFVNPAFCKMSGYTEEELLTRTVFDMKAKNQNYSSFDKSKGNMEGQPIEVNLQRKDQHEYITEIIGKVITIGKEKFVLGTVRDITERKLVEASLLKEKSFIDSAINSLPGISYLFDENGRFLRWNKNLEVVSGYSAENISMMSPLDLFVGEDKKLIEERIQEVFIKGESTAEAELVSKDGSRTPYFFTGLSFMSEGQNYLVGMGIDMSDRLKVEKELQERRDENTKLAIIAKERGELQDWINTFDIFVGKFDPNGIGMFFNEAPIKAGGLTKDNVVGKYFPDTRWWSHSEVERARIVECFKKAKAGLSSRIETNFRSADGTPVPIIFNCQPVMDADGKVSYITAEGKTIIEEVKLRDALQEEKATLEKRVKERTSELVEANKKLGDEIIDRKRMEETIRGQNKVFEQLATGSSLEEVLSTLVEVAEEDNPGMICSVLLLDKEKKKLLHGAAPSLPNFYNEAINGLEIGLGAGSCGTAAYTGERVIVEDVMTHPYWAEFCEIAKKAGLRACWSEPIISSTYQILGTFAMYYREPRKPDQSDLKLIKTTAYLAGIAIEKKRAEEELRKAYDELEVKVAERTRGLAQANIRLEEMDRLKSEFLATISHELRTPLNSIIGFTGIILKGITGEINEEQRKQLSMVYGSARHLLSLINDILDLSRIESGKMEIFVEKFKVGDVISEVVQTLSPMISQKGLMLLTEIPDETLEIYSDRKSVLQLLLNLVNNAIKFTDKGVIKIECKIDNDNLKVSVSDTGIGIKRENMEQLFESFRQIDGKAQRRYQGAGLGLYLCKKLVTLLGGEIWAESEYEKGSRFTFTLALRFKKGG